MENKCPMCNGSNVVEVYCEKCNGKGFFEGFPNTEDCLDCAGWGVPCLGEMECLDCEYSWGEVELETA
jgi:hypothetical protein